MTPAAPLSPKFLARLCAAIAGPVLWLFPFAASIAADVPQYAMGPFAGSKPVAADGTPARQAYLWKPSAVAIDKAVNLYIAEFDTNRVRKMSKDGTLTTYAGNGGTGKSGDGGRAVDADVPLPLALAMDGAGNLYIGQLFGARRVTPDGIITTVLN